MPSRVIVEPALLDGEPVLQIGREAPLLLQRQLGDQALFEQLLVRLEVELRLLVAAISMFATCRLPG